MTALTTPTLSVDRARHLSNLAEVVAKESALLEALRGHPGASAAELAKQEGRPSTGDRLRRLASRGAVERVSHGRWRIAGEPEAEPQRAPPAEPEPDDPRRWIRNVNRYVRDSSGEAFHVARFG